MPSKPKTKLKKGKTGTLSPRKQPRKATRRAQACTAHLERELGVAEEHFMYIEVPSDPSHDLASRLDIMMDMIVALSQNVNGQDEAVHEREDTPSTSLHRLLVKRRRATHPNSPAREFSIDQVARQMLEKSLRQAALVADSTSDDTSSSEEGLITGRKKRTLKIWHGMDGCHSG